MIILITAISPEANAILSVCPMNRIYQGSFSVYESEDSRFRLLVTGSGKLNAAVAVSEYLSLYPKTETDIFCNIGICGCSDTSLLHTGYLCPSVTDCSSHRSLYPELYAHPFREAYLYTADTPVTTGNSLTDSSKNLPVLYDMEAYGIAFSLFRKVMPSRCFFYKIVSDFCNGHFPSSEEVTELILPHLDGLLHFLSEESDRIISSAFVTEAQSEDFTELVSVLNELYPLSVTMERKLRTLLSYAACIGKKQQELLALIPNDCENPHKKRTVLTFLELLEQFLLGHAPSTDRSSEPAGPSSCFSGCLQPRRFPARIYVEEQILNTPVTQRILSRFSSVPVVIIDHYKDIFNRARQDLHRQQSEPCLILAKNTGTLFYPGAPVCQSFGEEHFIYTSCIMNCLYDCDYCYLQGMYPSRNLVIFVNLEDYFKELDSILKKHPAYLCCSYDSDLTALSGLFPHAEEFCRYAASHPDLKLELRTKSAALPFIETLPAAKNIILAFTLSPDELIKQYEHYTPSLKARLLSAKAAARQGVSLRLCIDPILDVPNAEALYSTLVDDIFSVLSPEEITDISLGVFRLSKEYLKQLRKAKPNCCISHYPYHTTDGVCHYSASRCDLLLHVVKDALCRHHIKETQLYIWTPEQSEKGDSHADQ